MGIENDGFGKAIGVLMFGLFGKTGFEIEISKLDAKAKIIADGLIRAMNNFDLQRQMDLLQEMVKICDQKIQCCREYGKKDHIRKYENEKNKYLELIG